MLLRSLYCRSLHRSSVVKKRTTEVYVQQAKQLLEERQLFEDLAKEDASKETFLKVIDIYLERQKLHRRGHIEFLQAAMLQLSKYGLQRDIEVYKKLLAVFPPGGKIAGENVWQVEFKHYPRQQDTAIELLCMMEKNAVQPDDEVGYILADIFGQEAHVFSKFQRMMYWMPKLRGSNPYPFPAEGLPDDEAQLAEIMLQRMSPDPLSKVTVFRNSDPGFQELIDADDKFIAWSQSPRQCTLLKQHPISQPLFIEGPYFVFARHRMLNYFVLRCDPPKRVAEDDGVQYNYYGKISAPVVDCKFNFMDYFLGKGSSLAVSGDESEPPSVHEQEDGTNFALCITGSATKASAVTWIRLLQTLGGNARLGELSLIFRMFSQPPPGPDAYDQDISQWLDQPQIKIPSGIGTRDSSSNNTENLFIASSKNETT